jgi:ribosomal protein S18 acetylase RimI-like enzyme
MNPMTDLGQVANLIEEAFAGDLDDSGQSALQELRWLNRFRPFLWWTLLTNFEQTNFLTGFVWEEDGRIVGNVTINQVGPNSRRWSISNVAVDKNYRGRGIAANLLMAGFDMVKNYNGSSILLQVRADNLPAKKLYNSFKFKEIGGTAYLQLNQVLKVNSQSLPSGVILRTRQYDWRDNRQVYKLIKATTPTLVQQEWPVRQSQIWIGEYERVEDFFRWLIGNTPAYWVAEDNRNLIAAVTIQPGLWKQPHTIELTVHPEWRGHLEKPLISRALKYLSRWKSQSVVVKHLVDHTEAITVFKEYGFQEKQALLWMKWQG